MATANDVLNIARSQIGYSRWDDPQPGTIYGRWYAELMNAPEFGVSGVPFCAMGASWTLSQANATCAGFPGAYCPTMLSIAKSQDKVLANKRDAKSGDIAYFNWDGGVVDHVGFVEINQGDYLQTIEFNTGNGQVLRRTRKWEWVEAIVRPNYDGVSQPANPPSTSNGNSSTPSNDYSQPEAINEDGWWGPRTTAALQRYLGTDPDGVISGQDRGDMRTVNRGGLQYDTWEIGSGGSDVIRALQSKIGATPDGYFGVKTCRSLQAYLGTKIDAYVSGPSNMVRELQRRLNSNSL